MSTNRRNVKSAKDVHAAHTLACVGNWGVTRRAARALGIRPTWPSPNQSCSSGQKAIFRAIIKQIR
jgi:hypothetical protein